MKKISEADFMGRSDAHKEAIAKLPENRDMMQEARSMCDPHGKLDRYDSEQWVQLAEAVYIIDGELVAPASIESACVTQ